VELYSTPREDLYVIFAGLSNDGNRYEITTHLNPLVWWVWFGAAIMFFGTVITLLPDKKGAFAVPQLSLRDTSVLDETVKLK
jgi:cytochrome c-type biogenesis protein CcmF